MAGLTEDGLVIRTREEIAALIRGTIQDTLAENGEDPIDLDTSIEGIMIDQVAADLADQWEALAALYAAFQGRARGTNADWYAAITGTLRRPATPTRVPVTVNLNAGFTLSPERVASIDGNPDAQFRLVEAVTNTGGSAADVDALFECLTLGPVPALAGKLTVIDTPIIGWNSITNAAEGIKGRAAADDAELALARVLELAARGTRTTSSIRANVSKVEGVISVDAFENVQSVIVSGRPPKSIEVVIWDGDGGAANDEVAQAIYDKAPEAIEIFAQGGPGTSAGFATTDTDEQVEVAFTRATPLRCYVSITVAGATCSAAQIKDALVDRGNLFRVAEVGSYDELIQAVREALPATIGRITSLTFGTSAAPVTTVVTPSYAEIIRIANGDVAVTGVS